jgi:UDP-N-acetylmuramate--alanine ligase
MVASILEGAGRDPGFLIGGEYPGLGGGSRWGQGEHFVAEACEFDRSFLNLHPAHAIVTNIEEDHLDYFRSLDEIQEAFAEFAGHLPAQGTLVLNADCPHSVLLARRSRAAVSRFSLQAGSGDWWAEEVQPRGGGIEFLARSASGQGARIALAVPGIHNVRNGLAAIALLSRLGLSLERIAGGLERFSGVRRRFEVLLREPVTVIDDYAHHPTEIEAVLRAARETFAGRPIRLVFQPHQHSRMRRFLADFAAVLAPAEEVVVAEVFRARDSLEEVSQVKAAALVAEVQRLGGRALHLPTFSEILDHLRGSLLPGEVVICLGAGDITVLAKRIAEGPLLRGPLRERCPA